MAANNSLTNQSHGQAGQRLVIALLASTQDDASMNVWHLLNSRWKMDDCKFESTPIYHASFPCADAYLLRTDERSVHCERIDERIQETLNRKIDALIFITKHDSKSGRPSFSVHTQGNWSRADLGGKQKEIAICPVVLKHTLFLALQKNNAHPDLPGFEVVNECTHHGPSIKIPSMFIEIGSTRTEWINPAAGKILADAIEQGLQEYAREYTADNQPAIIGFGGTHTCSNFARLVESNKIYLSHVCPEYALDGLEPEMIAQAITKTTGSKPRIIIDWKGMNSAQRIRMLDMLKQLTLAYQTLSDLKKECDASPHK